MQGDPSYDAVKREYVDTVRRQIGLVDFPDLIFLRSDYYVELCNGGRIRNTQPRWGAAFRRLVQARKRTLTAGRDPLYPFAAAQRQLGYPEVPRPKPRRHGFGRSRRCRRKLREMDLRIKLMESENFRRTTRSEDVDVP